MNPKLRQLISNQAAISTQETGGATISLKTGDRVTTGFVVAISKGLERVVDSSNPFTLEFGDYLTSNKVAEVVRVAKMQGIDLAFGTWVNHVDGKLYLDIVEVEVDQTKAEDKAKARQQLAYYNLDQGREYRV